MEALQDQTLSHLAKLNPLVAGQNDEMFMEKINRNLYILMFIFWLIIGPGKDIIYNACLLISHSVSIATIVENRMEHVTCIYEFELSGSYYHETGYNCGNLDIGDRIKIYYVPELPNISRNEPPGTNFLVNVFGSALLLFIFFWIQKFRNAELDKEP